MAYRGDKAMTVYAMNNGRVVEFQNRFAAIDWLACENWNRIPEGYNPSTAVLTFDGKPCYILTGWDAPKMRPGYLRDLWYGK